jgi:hypothetical protein
MKPPQVSLNKRELETLICASLQMYQKLISINHEFIISDFSAIVKATNDDAKFVDRLICKLEKMREKSEQEKVHDDEND